MSSFLSTPVFMLFSVAAFLFSVVEGQLPATCTPSSTQCSFYSDCVEAAIPCGSSGYAIGYGKKFCNLFTQNFALFDSNGQRWIDNVRYCLQGALIPEVELAEEGQAPTCTALQNFAFASHVNCYVDPTGSHLLADSVCALSLQDNLALLWTIKSAFIQAFSATITQMVNTLAACAKDYIASVAVAFDSAVISATVTLQSIETEIAAKVAAELNWPVNSVIAFPSGNTIVVALLATASSSTTKDAVATTTVSASSPSAAASTLAGLVNSGSFSVSVNGQEIRFTGATVCGIDGCPSSVESSSSSDSSSSISTGEWIAIGVGSGVAGVVAVAGLVFALWRKSNKANTNAESSANSMTVEAA